jgi:hypothetical protein
MVARMDPVYRCLQLVRVPVMCFRKFQRDYVGRRNNEFKTALQGPTTDPNYRL